VTDGILALVAAIKASYLLHQSAEDAIDREIKTVLLLLDPLPNLTGSFVENNHPVIQNAAAAFDAETPSTAALAESIRPVIEFLPWRYSYPPRNDAPDLGEHIAFAEIIGPEAPFRSDSVCLGLTLIAPQTLYSAHRHPAVELYYVVTGTAAWTLNGVTQEHPPGTYILHPSQAIHAMETHAQPLLAIYSWSGADVQTTSIYTQSNK
jgi:quercetin dioxygenase-like cupin family protein